MCPTLQETELDYPENVGAIVWKAAISAKAEFRAICRLTIRTCPECTLGTSRLSTTDSTISGATVPTTTTKNANSRQFSISGGPDESAGSSNLPSQTIPNSRGNASATTLRSGKASPQPAPQQLPRSIGTDSEPDANSQMPQQDKILPLSFPTWTLSARKPEFDEELLKMF
ncbi:hypothetical protein CR513_05522, partial [Mucuna pruriens]